MDRHALLEQGSHGTGYRLSTVHQTFEAIQTGESPWIAIGNFLDDWRRAVAAQRPLLIADPIQISAGNPLRRWAALLAAITEWLCHSATPQLASPSWTLDPALTLPQPWFLVDGVSMRGWQIAQSPAPFRARNIFTDDGVIARA
jgi:hypothetical protein